MPMMEIPYIAKELIESYLDTLIIRVREDVDTTKIYESEAIMGKSQFSNLTGVARETESLEVIITWVQYQIGRDTKATTWGKNGFGERVIQSLRALGQTASGLATNQIQDMQPLAQLTTLLRIGLVRQYIGQMERYITYRRVPRGGRNG